MGSEKLGWNRFGSRREQWNQVMAFVRNLYEPGAIVATQRRRRVAFIGAALCQRVACYPPGR
jgi:hypothetical protein